MHHSTQLATTVPWCRRSVWRMGQLFFVTPMSRDDLLKPAQAAMSMSALTVSLSSLSSNDLIPGLFAVRQPKPQRKASFSIRQTLIGRNMFPLFCTFSRDFHDSLKNFTTSLVVDYANVTQIYVTAFSSCAVHITYLRNGGISVSTKIVDCQLSTNSSASVNCGIPLSRSCQCRLSDLDL